MTFPDGWTRGSHTHDGVTHPTYRRGTGPGVVVIHEIPGITPEVATFAEEVVDAGFTVVMPSLFGTDGAPMTARTIASAIGRVCVSREFTKLPRRRDHAGRRVAALLGPRAARRAGRTGRGGAGDVLHRRLRARDGRRPGGRGARALPAEHARSPSGAGARPTSTSPPATSTSSRDGARPGSRCSGLRFRYDPAVGTRFDTLTRELGDAFIRVELQGKGHSTVTAHRQQEAVDAVLSFLVEHLR